jgi:DnaK suppressor protein
MSIKKHALNDIKSQLEDRKRELEGQLALLATEKITDDQVQDPGDQAISSTMETLRNSMQDTELQEYNHIVSAIEKIEGGTYGICIDCGGDIAERRLQSYPNAARCLGCQEIFEDKQP